MQALVINGRRDGGPDGARLARTPSRCDELGFECARVPAVFTEMPSYRARYGDHTAMGPVDRYVRGCRAAHRDALEAVARGGARAAVLEDDIALPASGAREAVRDFARATEGVDLAYAGHCMDTLCAHALLVTPEGAERILGSLDWDAATPYDNQLEELCQSGAITCAYADEPPGARYSDPTWTTGGIVRQVREANVAAQPWF